MSIEVRDRYRVVLATALEYASSGWLFQFPGTVDHLKPILNRYAKGMDTALATVKAWPRSTPACIEAIPLFIARTENAYFLGTLPQAHYDFHIRRARLELASQLERELVDSDLHLSPYVGDPPLIRRKTSVFTVGVPAASAPVASGASSPESDDIVMSTAPVAADMAPAPSASLAVVSSTWCLRFLVGLLLLPARGWPSCRSWSYAY